MAAGWCRKEARGRVAQEESYGGIYVNIKVENIKPNIGSIVHAERTALLEDEVTQHIKLW